MIEEFKNKGIFNSPFLKSSEISYPAANREKMLVNNLLKGHVLQYNNTVQWTMVSPGQPLNFSWSPDYCCNDEQKIVWMAFLECWGSCRRKNKIWSRHRKTNLKAKQCIFHLWKVFKKAFKDNCIGFQEKIKSRW